MAQLPLTSTEQEAVLAAIAAAETQTSGEIRVHLEAHCQGEAVSRAQALFLELGMTQTRDRNGVLVYVAYADRQLAIVGDQGIHAKVPAHFWDSTYALMREHFAQGRMAQGLCEGIALAGQQLQTHFPYQNDDQNELPDSLSWGPNA